MDVFPLELPWAPGGLPDGRNVSCGEGWWPLIMKLHEELEEIDPDYQVIQVKEKFGGLRYYVASHTSYEDYGPIVGKYESLSMETCEVCGKPGTCGVGEVSRYWIKTLCDQHRKEADDDRRRWNEEMSK